MHRPARLALLAACAITLNACQAAKVATNRCEREYVIAAGTLDAGSGGAVQRYELSGRTASSVEAHGVLEDALLRNRVPTDTGVTWVIATSGGAGLRLVVTQRARLAAGDRLTVSGPPGRRDWGLSPPPPIGTAGSAVEMAGGTAVNATGTIEVLRVAPLELGLDLLLPSGQSIQGSVRFVRGVEYGPCFT